MVIRVGECKVNLAKLTNLELATLRHNVVTRIQELHDTLELLDEEVGQRVAQQQPQLEVVA